MKGMTLCKRLGYTGTSLADAWEAHTLNHQSVTLNTKSFDFFQSELLQSNQSASVKATVSLWDEVPNGAVLSRKKARKDINSNPITPEKKVNVILDDENVFSNRKDSGMVLQTYNPHSYQPSEPSSSQVTISSDEIHNVTSKYRNLFTPINERANAIDDKILHLSEQIVDKHELETSPIPKPSPEETCVFGRICNTAHVGKLNSTSLVLEGSRDYSNGKRIELKVNNIPSYSLFPGQVVAVKGYNPQGNAIATTQIYDGVPSPYAKSRKADLMNKKPLYIMTTSGPYTNNNQEYEPFHDFLNFVQMNRPDVVILTGPFTTCDADSDTLSNRRFYMKIISLLEDVLEEEDLKTQFVIIPSLEDEVASPVYPQPPFSNGNVKTYKKLNLQTSTLHLSHKQIHCLSNPATFSINEVTFGVTSTDVLLHLSSEMIHLSSQNRMDCLVQHLLNQQSYYPLSPSKIPCDVTQWEKYGMAQSPDVLIVPSKLSTFCRRVKDTLVVNCGTLAKGMYGGSYADMWIFPMNKEKLESLEGDFVGHDVWDRSFVEIKKV